jgi:superfamily II DNA or RNA helicase
MKIKKIENINKTPNVVISTWQSSAKANKEFFDSFGCLITDECHLAAAKCLSEINQNMTTCKYKFGLSGSLKDAKSHILQLIGLFGQVYKPTSTSKMIAQGKITPIVPVPIILEYPDEVKKHFKPKTVMVDGKRKKIKISYQDEIKFIITNKKRNNFIAKLAISSEDKNTLVLFKELDHGKELFEIINKSIEGSDRKCYYIAGDIKTINRNKITGILEHRIGDIVVASYGTLSTGISINNLHRAISAHPFKSKIILLQSIGRLLRKHGSKSKAFWYHIIDSFCSKNYQNYSYIHGIECLKLFTREKFNYKIKKIKL